MRELVCELIISLDGSACGERSPGYFGYFGPDFADWVSTNTAAPHRILIGRRTYEMLNELQLLTAGLVDRLKLVLCPLVLGQTGREPAFAGLPDLGFDLLSTSVLDGRVLLLEYRPSGTPPYSE